MQVARVDEPGLELGERTAERVREAGEACRCSEAVQRRGGDGGPDDQLSLRIGDDRAGGTAVAGDAPEEVVERADVSGEERAPASQELALDALDVRPVRHDEHRISLECVQVALEEQGHLAGVRRPREQRQTLAGGHRSIVDLGPDSSRPRARAKDGTCVKRVCV